MTCRVPNLTLAAVGAVGIILCGCQHKNVTTAKDSQMASSDAPESAEVDEPATSSAESTHATIERHIYVTADDTNESQISDSTSSTIIVNGEVVSGDLEMALPEEVIEALREKGIDIHAMLDGDISAMSHDDSEMEMLVEFHVVDEDDNEHRDIRMIRSDEMDGGHFVIQRHHDDHGSHDMMHDQRDQRWDDDDHWDEWREEDEWREREDRDRREREDRHRREREDRDRREPHDRHEEHGHNPIHELQERMEMGMVTMEFLERQDLVAIWGIHMIKAHVEPQQRIEMINELLSSTDHEHALTWQRACRNAMYITLMETQVELDDRESARKTLMSMIEENMNGTGSKNAAEQE